jgi:hypothetical protein
LFYLFNCRKIRLPSLGKGFFDNKYIFMAAGALVILQAVFVYAPIYEPILLKLPHKGDRLAVSAGSRPGRFLLSSLKNS